MRNIDDVEFGFSSQVHFNLFNELKSIGQAKVNHRPEINKRRLAIYLSFDLNTPEGLLEKSMHACLTNDDHFGLFIIAML